MKSEQYAVYLDRKTNMKKSPTTRGGRGRSLRGYSDIWRNSLFFLKRLWFCAGQDTALKKMLQSTQTLKESPVSSRKLCPSALQVVLISIPRKRVSVSLNWEMCSWLAVSLTLQVILTDSTWSTFKTVFMFKWILNVIERSPITVKYFPPELIQIQKKSWILPGK